MGGLYIHIPFCRQACRYCDFHFTVSLQYQDLYTDMLVREIRMRKEEFREIEAGSIYLGGGTPSVLSGKNLEKIFGALYAHYRFASEPEITVECNPDDLSAGPELLRRMLQLGVNRLSIGIQSFREEDLRLMRRSHDVRQARQAVLEAHASGFRNLTADLMYGLPDQSVEQFRKNLEQVRTLPLNHLSAYHLTYEPGTVFDLWRKKGRLVPVDDELSAAMYRDLKRAMEDEGFEHYEVSSFARNGYRSRHNLCYWTDRPYLGFGPSAHSFDGDKTRSWNVASLKTYLRSLETGKLPCESEVLDIRERYHDYLLTRLRTLDGAHAGTIRNRFGDRIWERFSEISGPWFERGILNRRGEQVWIDPEHWLMADGVIRELFLD